MQSQNYQVIIRMPTQRAAAADKQMRIQLVNLVLRAPG